MTKFVKVLRFMLWASALFVALIGVVASSFYLVLAPNLPDVEQLRVIQLQTPLRIYSRDEKLVAEFGEQRRSPVAFEDVPPDLVQAFLAAEDSRFFDHHGVDIKGLSRATLELISTGKIQSGGSTITMQVAKNFFLSQERTFSRKFNEILLALKIEAELEKTEILELYFNKIYLGNRAYGIEAAANVYYGKSLSELSLAQKAMIAGLPKAPSSYNPIASPVRATIRRDWILLRMKELNMIDPEAYETAREASVSARYYTTQPEVEAPYAAEMARAEALRQIGPEAYTGGYKVYLSLDSRMQQAADAALRRGLIDYSKRHGYRGPIASLEPVDENAIPDTLQDTLADLPSNAVLTPAWVQGIDDELGEAQVLLGDGRNVKITLDSLLWANEYIGPNQQGPRPEKVSDVLKVGDVVHVELADNGQDAALSQKPVVQGAIVSLDPQDGAILALSGGFDFYMSKFNRANQARRQSGSNFKPFIYLAALENGSTPATIYNDAPVVFDDKQLETAWRPENSTKRFYGPTRLRKALYLSRNLVSIRLLRQLGIRDTVNFLEAFGFPTKRLPRDLSLALGSAAFTPLEIANAYAILANGGEKIEPYLIDRILDSEGEALFEKHPSEEQSDTPLAIEAEMDEHKERVADPRSVYILNDILKDVIRKGTAMDARQLGRRDLAGKTGTTNDQMDAWFSGFNSHNATSVWVGFDQPSTLGRREYGGRAALPIWMDYMKVALEGTKEASMARPNGIASIRIDPESGERARPGQADAMFELFLEENVPAPLIKTVEPGPATPDSPSQELFLEDMF